ncbi:hypothetical protein NDA13_001157 [Ustilago tritici]|nr:hypothetical protein NDA13_001157 [Ustilago tritici]
MTYSLCPCPGCPPASTPNVEAPNPSTTSLRVEDSVLMVIDTDTPSGLAPLEPLFLFANEATGPTSLASAIQTLHSSIASPVHDVVDSDALCRWALPTPEREAEYAAELARSLTPPPDADTVVDNLLAATPPQYATPVFDAQIQ